MRLVNSYHLVEKVIKIINLLQCFNNKGNIIIMFFVTLYAGGGGGGASRTCFISCDLQIVNFHHCFASRRILL